ncbi:MAG TPA: bifunctional riboflavin kinase/FAD synthetase [Gemmataceae bacterium]|nr:bifunctional riboflavin kinase/FAD synthetase [Gemmataceae bacterium]
MPTIVLSAADRPPDECRGGAVTVGNFDGVHRGHASLMAALQEAGRRVGGPAIAVTFDPHPLTLLAPGRISAPLTTLADRAELLQAAGADAVVVLRTTPELLAIQARDFLADVLGDRFGVKAVVEGYNFRFGQKRAGDVQLLTDWCETKGVELTIVPPLLHQGEPVSSGRVRAALSVGDVTAAFKLLGRPYRLRGVVGTGARRGHLLGFPTANLDPSETLIPGDGVFAARAVVDGKQWPAAVNIGPNPTFGESVSKVEAHLIGFDGDLYGRTLALDFIARMRGLQKFAGPEALIEQLRHDVAEANRLTGERASP